MRATLVTRVGEATFRTAQPWDTVAPRLLNFPRAFALQLLNAAAPRR